MSSAEEITQLYARFVACGSRVSTDSRDIESGSLFVALKGERFDGNRFVISALEAGAGHAVCDRVTIFDSAPPELKARITLVDDALETLQRLAAHHRHIIGAPILAITGTNGKTTTKELVRRVLACRFSVAATQGNLNNQIGVPLTLLSMGGATEFGVVEMGAGAPGEIALLCRIAQPNFGIITNIGLAHLEGFGDLRGVRQGKGELYDYLATHGGVAFYRAEDQTLSQMVAEREGLRAMAYPDATGDDMPCSLTGDYNRYNVASALAVGDYFDIPREESAEAIAAYVPDNQRSELLITPHNKLVVDCYNANPSSMRAAIGNLAAMPLENYLGRALVLGDMLELGAQSASMHRDILLLARQLSFEEVYLAGAEFSAAAAALGWAVPHFANVGELAVFLQSAPLRGRLVLVKGSRGMRLEEMLERL